MLAFLAGPLAWGFLAMASGPWVPGMLAPMLLLQMVVLYPILEELAFRGTLQSWLLSQPYGAARWGVSGANLITSLLFCAAHTIYQPPLWALATFIPSLVFGHYRERYGQILPSVLLHGWYNFGFLVFVMT